MDMYLLFSPKDENLILTYIYTKENGKVISYSYDEDYIVRLDEPNIKKLKDLEIKYPETDIKGNPVLLKFKFDHINEALLFLNGTLNDFKEGNRFYKKLPPVINPYDLDFDFESESEDYYASSLDLDDEENDFMDNTKEDEEDYYSDEKDEII